VFNISSGLDIANFELFKFNKHRFLAYAIIKGSYIEYHIIASLKYRIKWGTEMYPQPFEPIMDYCYRFSLFDKSMSFSERSEKCGVINEKEFYFKKE
jgi:hypothetical protein